MIHGEFEEEWLARVHSVCPGPARRIQALSTQPNFIDCVLPTINHLLNSGESIPENIAGVFLLLLGRESASPYVATLIEYQKDKNLSKSKDELSQWIAASTTEENCKYVLSEFPKLGNSMFNLLILSKIAALRPDLHESLCRMYLEALQVHPAWLAHVNQWKKKDFDKHIRKGFRILEQWRLEITL